MAHVIGQCFPWRLRLVEVISLSQQRLILGSSYPSTPSHLTLTSYVQPRTSRLLPLTSYFSRHIHRLTFLDGLRHDNLAYPHRVRRQRVRCEQHEVRQLPNLDGPLSLLFEKLPRRVDRDGADGLAGCHSLLRSELAPAGRYAVHRRPDNRQDIRRRHGRVMMQRDRDSPVESRAHRVDARRALRPQEHVPVPVAPVVYVARKERYVQPEVPHVVELLLTDRLRVDDRCAPVASRVRPLGGTSSLDHHPDRRVAVSVRQYLPAVLVPVRHRRIELLVRLERREPRVRGLSPSAWSVVRPAQVRRVPLYRAVGQQLHSAQAKAPTVPAATLRCRH